jgi:hypothetical protein
MQDSDHSTPQPRALAEAQALRREVERLREELGEAEAASQPPGCPSWRTMSSSGAGRTA